jgi:hypothetical protein
MKPDRIARAVKQAHLNDSADAEYFAIQLLRRELAKERARVRRVVRKHIQFELAAIRASAVYQTYHKYSLQILKQLLIALKGKA